MIMAAEVSRQIKSDQSSNSSLITRDFLGGCSSVETKELDLDLHVPNGWEKRLDLKSGKVYIQRCNPANSLFDQRNSANALLSPKFQDLNSIPKSTIIKPTLNLLQDSTSLDLKLVSNIAPPSNVYSSVCTLDKVKSALDRAEKELSSSSNSSKKRWIPPSVRSPSKSSSSLSNSSSLSMKEMEDEVDERWSSGQSDALLVAAACPGCLLYVLISKTDPKCPKCNSVIETHTVTKRPKIDLNISI